MNARNSNLDHLDFAYTTFPYWKDLIHDTHTRILALAPNYEIFDIKEKFGGLRYYIDLPSHTSTRHRDDIFQILEEAETRSRTILNNLN